MTLQRDIMLVARAVNDGDVLDNDASQLETLTPSPQMAKSLVAYGLCA